MRPILEGRPDEARAQRRDIQGNLSLGPERARQPVSRFGIDDEVGAYGGYQKASMVLTELGRLIGDDGVWAGLRRLREERLGHPSDWHDLQAAFEAHSGQDLGAFFDYWICCHS